MANEKQPTGSLPSRNGPGSGAGVDRFGGPVVDPTENVKALSEAANLRQDDLRAASEKFTLAAVQHVKELADQHAAYDRELHATEDKYNQQLREAEAKRIDAIRAVDVNAVSVASQRASDQATVLANQVAQSAEALRTLVAQTAATVASAQTQLGNALSERITKLEQAQYTGAGRASFADPQMEQLLTQMKALTSANATGSGQRQGISAIGSIVIGAAIVISATIGAVTFFSHNASSPSTQAVPR